MPSIKKGVSFINVAIPSTATGTVAGEYPYHALNWTNRFAYDWAMEYVLLGSLVVQAGTYANWTSLILKHFNIAGATVDALTLNGTITPIANETMDITGVAATTGNNLMVGWLLQPGDSIELVGVCASASPAVSVTLCVDVPR